MRWDTECTVAFEQLAHPLVLLTPKSGEILHTYLFISKYVVSAVLFRNDESQERLIFYVSKALLGLESSYASLEQLVLALLIAARKLCPYFQAHSIVVLIVFPLRSMLSKLDLFRRIYDDLWN